MINVGIRQSLPVDALSVSNPLGRRIAMELKPLPIQAEASQILSQAIGVVGDLLRLP